ncbi:hypothetical protein [Taibaiella koreensis]|uniref:hypothetical protein n=1 Tax=Taibaiella koreensis TaxID=1268548 RepID=UPI000E59A7DF|nr:hypothetical protein [Taibaiella koreensis]
MKKNIGFILFLLTLCAFKGRAQQVWEGGKEKLEEVKEKGQKKVSQLKRWQQHVRDWGLDPDFNYALSLSGRLNTNGWSGGLCYLRQKSAGKKVLWQLHFSEIKHEKEARQQQTRNLYPGLGPARSYIFGKINNAYTLQLGYGREQMLFPALLDGNLSVSLRYVAGPAIALLKPYYLDLIYVDYNPEPQAHIQTERYSSGNSDHFLQPGFIQGSSQWSKGLGEIKYVPGLFAELAFAIEPEKPKAFVKTILIGGNAAFYTSSIGIMAERKAYPYQASFFVGLMLGKRWR